MRPAGDDPLDSVGAAPPDRPLPPGLDAAFAERLRQVAADPDRVPVEIDGRKLEARRGGTLLAAAMKHGLRLMHVCGARTLCTTCRIRVDSGAENLTPIGTRERLALRSRLVLSRATRLACQARVEGPVEARATFPLCGNLPGE